MTRETKINLIFLAIILALMLPAAFRMYAKRVNDYERKPMSMPTPMRLDAAYIDPQPQHPSVRRVVPPRILAWHRKMLARQFEQHPPADDGRWARFEAAASELGTFEILAAVEQPDSTHVYVLLWDQKLLPRLSSEAFQLRYTTDALQEAVAADDAADWQQAPLSIEGASPQPMPYEIRRELRDLGFVDPPHNLMLFRLATKQPLEDVQQLRLTLSPAPAAAAAASDQPRDDSEVAVNWQPWLGDETLTKLTAGGPTLTEIRH